MLHKLNDDIKQLLYMMFAELPRTICDIVYEWAGLLFLGGLVMLIVMIAVEMIWRV